MAKTTQPTGFVAMKDMMLAPMPLSAPPRARTPLFKPEKAVFPKEPIALKPPVKADSFPFAASVASSVSLIFPVSTPKAAEAAGSFPFRTEVTRLVPFVTCWKASSVFVAAVILPPRLERAVKPLNPA